MGYEKNEIMPGVQGEEILVRQLCSRAKVSLNWTWEDSIKMVLKMNIGIITKTMIRSLKVQAHEAGHFFIKRQNKNGTE